MSEPVDLSAGKRAFAEILIALLRDDAENWQDGYGGHTINHEPSGFDIWTGNGLFHVGLYRPEEIAFTFFQKWRAWRLIKKIKRRFAAEKQAAELARLQSRLSGMHDKVVSITRGKAA